MLDVHQIQHGRHAQCATYMSCPPACGRQEENLDEWFRSFQGYDLHVRVSGAGLGSRCTQKPPAFNAPGSSAGAQVSCFYLRLAAADAAPCLSVPASSKIEGPTHTSTHTAAAVRARPVADEPQQPAEPLRRAARRQPAPPHRGAQVTREGARSRCCARCRHRQPVEVVAAVAAGMSSAALGCGALVSKCRMYRPADCPIAGASWTWISGRSGHWSGSTSRVRAAASCSRCAARRHARQLLAAAIAVLHVGADGPVCGQLRLAPATGWRLPRARQCADDQSPTPKHPCLDRRRFYYTSILNPTLIL